MDWTLASHIASTLAACVVVVGGPFAVVSYWRASRTRRAEWLDALHQRFFDSDRHARVRRVLDYTLEPEYTELKQAVTQGSHHPLADELYGYLNFFEFLGSLRALRQFSDQEMNELFEYDLAMLNGHAFIVEALPAQGFENLERMLTEARGRKR